MIFQADPGSLFIDMAAGDLDRPLRRKLNDMKQKAGASEEAPRQVVETTRGIDEQVYSPDTGKSMF